MKLGHGEKCGRSLNIQQQCCLGEGTGIFEDGGDEKQICTIDISVRLYFIFYMASILVYETYKENRPS